MLYKLYFQCLIFHFILSLHLWISWAYITIFKSFIYLKRWRRDGEREKTKRKRKRKKEERLSSWWLISHIVITAQGWVQNFPPSFQYGWQGSRYLGHCFCCLGRHIINERILHSIYLMLFISIVVHVIVVHWFQLLYLIPLCEYSIIYLPAIVSLNIWVVSMFLLLFNVLLCSFIYNW